MKSEEKVLSGSSGTRGSADQKVEANKGTVMDFYESAINHKGSEAPVTIIGGRYVQHNPLIADGIEGFRAFLSFVKTNYPNLRSEIKRVFADGDYVILHTHGVRMAGERGSAIMDIFKLEEGKIVEHWDVIQPIPESTINQNGMF
jgi:predicted SnoaL-like aldol condensation-catalyzing enzyme